MKKILFILIFLTTTFVFGMADFTSLKLGYIDVQLSQIPPTISEIIASPNPFSVKTTISFISVKDQEVSFTIKNLLGKTVFSDKLNVQKGENQFDFYKNDLNPGMYLYSLQTTNEIISKRLVIK
ncbi:MAG: T9SS type A sorting domain-containing protein [Flavobacteriaceae bacterium]|nr:T9SS type A sorting domain-containing protein [Flavobacteriaceae bacterium]